MINAGTTWTTWVTDSTSSTTLNNCDGTWVYWNDDTYTTGGGNLVNTITLDVTATSEATWTVWTTGAGGGCVTNADTSTTWHTWIGTGGGGVVRPQLTEEELQALEVQRLEQERRYQEEHRLRLAAEERAEKLLLENLSLKQREEYRRDKHFVVVGRSGRRYRVRKGRSANVDVIDRRGCVEHRLCAYPRLEVPDYDTMLAQKLILEHDDDEFLAVAIRHSSFDRQTPVLPALQ